MSEGSHAEQWARIASRISSIEGLPHGDEKKAGLSAVASEVRQYLVELESAPLGARLEALSMICASPYFSLALDEVQPPSSVAYALISKGLYHDGMCETPPEYVDQVDFLTDGLEDFKVPGGIGRHRLSVLSNPRIDPRILEDEFTATNGNDLDVVDALLANPISPLRLLRKLFGGEFDSDDWDGFELLSRLVKHPALSEDILQAISEGSYVWEVDEEGKQELSEQARSKFK